MPATAPPWAIVPPDPIDPSDGPVADYTAPRDHEGSER